MRIFLAIDLPDTIKKDVIELENMLLPYSKYVRLTPYENLHLTVKFLGEQNDMAQKEIVSIVKELVAQKRTFKICLSKSGIFGGIKNPRIVWIGEDNAEFEGLAYDVNQSLNKFRYENKKPVCHLSVGRVKNMRPNDALAVMSICRDFVEKYSLCFNVHSVYLYKSRLLKSGAVYDKIEKFNLKGV
jgi:2'-5' RNA ligase